MMKIGFELKLGIGIVVVFGLLLVGFVLYEPMWYKYYEWRLESDNPAAREAAVKALTDKGEHALPYIKRWLSSRNAATREAAAVVLAKSKDFKPARFDDKTFLNFAQAASRDWAAKQIPREFLNSLKDRLVKLRPYGRNEKYYDTYYRCCSRTFSDWYPAALGFIAGCQAPDGRWFSETGTRDDDLHTTALCLLACLGNGHTHRVGQFRKNVRKGLRLLLSHEQREDGSFSDDTLVNALCTMAVSEAYAMTKDKKVGRMALIAAENLLKSQLPGGGFPRRTGGNESDIRTTCWATIALRSPMVGRRYYYEEKIFEEYLWTSIQARIRKYIVKMLEKEKDSHSLAGLTISAIFTGIKRKGPLLETAWTELSKNLPSWEKERDAEYIYFGTYSWFQKGGKGWKTWYTAGKNILVKRLIHGELLDGSWNPVMGPASKRHGRIFTTALNTLTLEIYYRYARVHK